MQQNVSFYCGQGILGFFTSTDGLPLAPPINIEVDVPFVSDLIGSHLLIYSLEYLELFL